MDALLSLMSSRGAESLTVRNVAAEAGVSAGAVQHHFTTKESLLVAAMTAVDERFRERLRQRVGRHSTARERLVVFCREIACVEGPDLTDAIVWTAFAARAATDPNLRAHHAAAWAETEAFMLLLLEAAYPHSAVTGDDAALLLAVTDGIAVARAAEQNDRMTPVRAATLIDSALADLDRRARPPADPTAH